jgi:hypothetical protein
MTGGRGATIPFWASSHAMIQVLDKCGIFIPISKYVNMNVLLVITTGSRKDRPFGPILIWQESKYHYIALLSVVASESNCNLYGCACLCACMVVHVCVHVWLHVPQNACPLKCCLGKFGKRKYFWSAIIFNHIWRIQIDLYVMTIFITNMAIYIY